ASRSTSVAKRQVACSRMSREQPLVPDRPRRSRFRRNGRRSKFRSKRSRIRRRCVRWCSSFPAHRNLRFGWNWITSVFIERVRTMNRRKFLASSTAAAASKPVLMKLGCQSSPTNETHVKYFARYGVKNICGYPTIPDRERLYATVDELKSMKDLCAKNGV